MEYKSEVFAGEDKDYLIKMPYGLRIGLSMGIFFIVLIISLIGIINTLL